MAKYTRKIFLISKIKKLFLIVKNNPTFLMEFLKNLNTPIIHKFLNPYTNEFIDETESQSYNFKIVYFMFFKNVGFTKKKMKQRGRIKRKIARKLILKNQLID